MLKRREISLELSNGKKYVFSERNKNDMDFGALQDKLRTHKKDWIYANIDNPDDRLALLIVEMKRVYTDEEINSFIYGNKEELKKVLYDSFKIKNDLSFEEFCELVPDDKINDLVDRIMDLEFDELKPAKKKAAKKTRD